MGCFFNLSKSSSINPNNVYIWNEYISDYKNNSIYSSQMAIKQISYKNKTMIFDYVVNGEVIENGYPLYIVLHDGEINNSAKNNAEYNQAKLRYLSSISVGIVLITRGISENSNMHYNTEGIVILDKLIKNFIAFKNVDPNRVYLLRGNHESRQTNQNYGFHVECLKKYNQSSTVWLYINEMFDYLPLAAVIDNKLFCIHGGLSPSIQKIEDIKVLERCKDIPTEGPMADLVWSDPDENTEGFKISERGAGFLFGETVIDKFLHLNKMETIVRAHQLCKEGYLILFGGKIITVWSAPNYCGRIYNYASIMEVDEELNKFFNIFEDNERLVSNQEYRAKVLECFNPEMDKYFD